MESKTIAALAAAGTAVVAGAGATAVSLTKKALKKPENKRKLYDLADGAIGAVTNGLATAIPSTNYERIEFYGSEGFMPGDEEFTTTPGSGWRLGCAKASILPDDVGENEYYIAGFLAFPPHRADGVIDDILVRSICIDDGTGRGATVFAVVDCVGLSNKDVRDIRLKLADFAAENNIKSINISASHCHSGIDTLGIWGKIPGSLGHNVISILAGKENYISGRNDKFMDNLAETAAEVIKQSYADMRDGELYMSVEDITELVRDKRPPKTLFTDMNVLTFVPSDGSKETVAVFMAAHPTNMGYANCKVSGDYPYYLCSALEESGKNGIFFQGAELSIATNRGVVNEPWMERFDEVKAYGERLAEIAQNGTGREKIEPYLNIRLNEIFMNPSNGLMLALGKSKLINHKLVQVGEDKNDVRFVTEIGYVQLGSKYRIALMPGEIAPEIILGGAYDAEDAYNKTDWDYPALCELTDGKLFVIGLCNDEIGYVIPDNDYGSVIAPLHYEEMISVGWDAASKIVREFERLMSEI